MNLAAGEKILQILVASKAFGEVNPGSMQIQQLELAVKLNRNGKIDAEMKIDYSRGTSLYNVSDINFKELEKTKLVFLTFARMTNQPGVFRNYDFSDCLSDEEMMFRLLAIPEYRAVSALPKDKLIYFNDIKKVFECPVCKCQISTAGKKCPECGTLIYQEKGRRYYESEIASFFPLSGPETEVHLLKVDYINIKSSYLYTHITYVQEPPIYLGGVYILMPQSKNVEFRVILNKPWGYKVSPEIFSAPYHCRLLQAEDLEMLSEHGSRLFFGSGTEPYFVVSFTVWDYACLEEVGSHVNHLLRQYNHYLERIRRSG